MVEALREYLENRTPEEIKRDEDFFAENSLHQIPTGWIDIEEYLPIVTGQDVIDNGGLFKKIKVRNKEGKEGESQVADHNVWYYMAKEQGITHWLNEK